MNQDNRCIPFKGELSKARELVEMLKMATNEVRETKAIEALEVEKENMLARVATMSNEVTMKERLRLLEMKLERKAGAYDDLKKENIRLREAAVRKRNKERSERVSKSNLKENFPTRSLTDLSEPKESRPIRRKHDSESPSKLWSTHNNEDALQYDSEDAGYCSSLRSFSRSLQSSTSLLSLDQSGLNDHPIHQRYYNGSRSYSSSNLRKSESLTTINNHDSPKMERFDRFFEPTQTSTPKRLSFHSRSSSLTNEYKDCSSDCESVTEVHRVFLKPSKSKVQKPLMVSTSMQTDKTLTHSVKSQAAPMMVAARVQTSPDKVKYYLKPREEFNTDTYLPAQRIREITRRPRDVVREGDLSRLQDQIEDKRSDIRMLRQMLREKDEALARQNADLKILRREVSKKNNISRSTPAILPKNDPGHDVSINLKEGDDADSYGQISQVRPGQIQELKTIRKTVKNVNGVPIKYSTKVSVKCQKVAVFF